MVSFALMPFSELTLHVTVLANKRLERTAEERGRSAAGRYADTPFWGPIL